MSSSTQQRERNSVPAKLIEVRSRIGDVAKTGAHEQGFAYATWADVLGAAREHLDDAGLHLHLSVLTADVIAPGMTQIVLAYSWIDVQSGDQLDGRWVGQGWDSSDKAVYKALTGALKYLVLDTFLIATYDDPESGGQAPLDGSAAARQGATRIPRARAQAIVESAKSAGIAESVFKAKLADIGSAKVTHLNVDQAEAVEAFIAAEARAEAGE